MQIIKCLVKKKKKELKKRDKEKRTLLLCCIDFLILTVTIIFLVLDGSDLRHALHERGTNGLGTSGLGFVGER